jgi:predicted metal-binding protein
MVSDPGGASPGLPAMAVDGDELTVSVCMTCRDGRERSVSDVRAGARFADAIAEAIARRQHEIPALTLNRVICMSQCNRPCTVALTATAPVPFICIFAGLDPDRQADQILDLVTAHRAGPQRFLPAARQLDPTRAELLRYMYPWTDPGTEPA